MNAPRQAPPPHAREFSEIAIRDCARHETHTLGWRIPYIMVVSATNQAGSRIRRAAARECPRVWC